MSAYRPRRAAHHRPGGLSTQERQPWRATLRTMIQTSIPLILALPAILPIVQTWVDENRGGVLPESAAVIVAGGIATLTAVSGLIARLMAVPAVNQWFRDHLHILAPESRQHDGPTTG